MRLVLTCAVLVILHTRVAAEPVARQAIDAVITDRLALVLPPGLGVTQVHVPRSMARLEVDPQRVTIDLPAKVRVGRASVKVGVRGKAPVYVQVVIGKLAEVAVALRPLAPGALITADDIAIEHRAVETTAIAGATTLVGATVTNPLTEGAVITSSDVALAPALPRGTRVVVEMRRGGVRVRGNATLELAARPGAPATARLAHTKTMVRGTLRAPSTLVVEEEP